MLIGHCHAKPPDRNEWPVLVYRPEPYQNNPDVASRHERAERERPDRVTD